MELEVHLEQFSYLLTDNWCPELSFRCAINEVHTSCLLLKSFTPSGLLPAARSVSCNRSPTPEARSKKHHSPTPHPISAMLCKLQSALAAAYLLGVLVSLLVCKLEASQSSSSDLAPSKFNYAADDPLNAYINAPEPDFAWYEVPNSSFTTLFGGQAHVLNVTSQRWLEASKASGPGPDGELWTHQVVVIVPKGGGKPGNVNVAYLTGGCNENANAVPKKTDEDILVVDEITRSTGSIGIAVFQIPNCPIVFPSDPIAKRRTEDAILAYAWYEYLNDPVHNATWLPRLPMAKAAFQCMRAAEEFLAAGDDSTNDTAGRSP